MNPTVKYRNMLAQVFLVIITCGIYVIYWFYQTSVEMANLDGDPDASPALWTVLLFLPPLAFYSHYKHAELFEDISSDHMNKWIVFILWIVFCPAVWFIVQSELNRRAEPSPAMA